MNSFSCGLTRMGKRRAERPDPPCHPAAEVIYVYIQGVSHER
jgi:hypothetical protein